MNILVINAGSSSLKFQVFKNDHTFLKGSITEIGSDHSQLMYAYGDRAVTKKISCQNHADAMHQLLDVLLQSDVHDVEAVGHRVVHGGSIFIKPIQVSSGIIKKLELMNHLAPLHNPSNILAIKEAMTIFDHVPHVAVFDTAFHSTIPEHIHLIPIPEEFKHDGLLRKYGFHGTSHEYVYNQIEKFGAKKGRVISAHLGNGESICAIKNGRSINNSMGFTPLPGPIMGTRTGDVDFGIATFLHEHDGLSIHEIDSLFNHQGGLVGICGISDIKEIYDRRDTDHRYALALERLFADVARIIAGYTADLGGVDTIVFTAGAGEGAPWLREHICARLTHLGVRVDTMLNTTVSEGIISSSLSKVKVLVIHTDEEKMIAMQVKHLLSK